MHNGVMDFVPYVKASTIQHVAHNIVIVWDLNVGSIFTLSFYFYMLTLCIYERSCIGTARICNQS